MMQNVVILYQFSGDVRDDKNVACLSSCSNNICQTADVSRPIKEMTFNILQELSSILLFS